MDKNFSAAICKNLKTALDNQNFAFLKQVILEEHVKLILINSPELMYEVLTGVISHTERKRGRPKNKKASNVDLKRYYQNLACKLKAHLTGRSFSSLWEMDYLPSIKRPTQTDLDIFQCAAELLCAEHEIDPFSGKNRQDSNSRRSYEAMRLFGLNRLKVEAIDWFGSNRKAIGIEAFIEQYWSKYCYDDYSNAYYAEHIHDKDFSYYVCVDEELLADFKLFSSTINGLVDYAQ
jgi:hypothetical protein